MGSKVWWDENEALCAEKSDDRSPIRYIRLSTVLIRGAFRLPFDFNEEDEGPQLFCEGAGRALLPRTVILDKRQPSLKHSSQVARSRCSPSTHRTSIY
jgi:hypothetical protein